MSFGFGYMDVSIDEAQKLIESEDVEIIDVRTVEEYEEGHLQNAKLYPMHEIRRWMKELDPNKKYLLVCRAAHRSAMVGQFLVLNGYKNIYNMTGGMIEWTGNIEK